VVPASEAEWRLLSKMAGVPAWAAALSPGATSEISFFAALPTFPRAAKASGSAPTPSGFCLRGPCAGSHLRRV